MVLNNRKIATGARITPRTRYIGQQYVDYWYSLPVDERNQQNMNEWCHLVAEEQFEPDAAFGPISSVGCVGPMFSGVKRWLKDEYVGDRADVQAMKTHCAAPDFRKRSDARQQAAIDRRIGLGFLQIDTDPIIDMSAQTVRTTTLQPPDGTLPAQWWNIVLCLMVVSMRRLRCLHIGEFSVDPLRADTHVIISSLSKKQNNGEPFAFPVIGVTPQEFVAAVAQFKTCYTGSYSALQNAMDKGIKTLPEYTELLAAYLDKFDTPYTPHHSRALGAAWYYFHVVEKKLVFLFVLKELFCHKSAETSAHYADIEHVPDGGAPGPQPAAEPEPQPVAQPAAEPQLESAAEQGPEPESEAEPAVELSEPSRKRPRDESDLELMVQNKVAGLRAIIDRAREMEAGAVAEMQRWQNMFNF
ncbi:hypothetical protein JKP88DRAFT_254801 [Tribonema minus]|uniref:Uncharacterized protein n=1 Tax=Tribonema minus TaxID=303371 RepID=A0A836CGJ6_9STRA|nr:hypothetical protein JKP88DRAFT_256120 [Tribonema minus]KAG5185740.1 hypothetical protein JKP88DRAFT_254801 [Tribonema minus]